MREIFKKFLPQGRIFDSENELIDEFIVAITKNFSVVERYICERTSEIPGNLSTHLSRWETILEVEAKGIQAERNHCVLGKLNSLGGCSLRYLREVASRLAGRRISVNDDKSCLHLEFSGINLELMNTFSCSSTCKKQLREFEREEGVICAVERVKHAHIDSRYYNKEKTVYAQD
ncbi:MAG: hypothetical protein AB8G05_16875 [Oligoflexales bacterium]